MRRTIHLCHRSDTSRCLACGEVAARDDWPATMRSRVPTICLNPGDWATIYRDHAEYRRCVDPPDPLPPRVPAPTEPGHYWAEWRIAEAGSFGPDGAVFENKPPDSPGQVRVVWVWRRLRDLDDETLLVDVAGVEVAQPLDNFVWRSAR